MKLGISTHIFGLWPLCERHLELIRDAGFEAVELWAMAPHLEIEKPGSVAFMGKLARKVGLEILTVHLPFYRRFGDPDFGYLNLGDPCRKNSELALELIAPVLAEAPETGIRTAVLHGIGDVDGTGEQLTDLFIKDVMPVLADAWEKGVTLAVENIMTPMTAAKPLADLIDKVDHPGLRVCLDVGHAHAQEHLIEAVEILGDRIVSLHVHDNDGEDDEHLPPGEGTIDWTRAVPAIKGLPSDPILILELIWPVGMETMDEKIFSDFLRDARSRAKDFFGL